MDAKVFIQKGVSNITNENIALKKWYPKKDYNLKVKIIIQIFGKQPFFPIDNLKFQPMIGIQSKE